MTGRLKHGCYIQDGIPTKFCGGVMPRSNAIYAVSIIHHIINSIDWEG